MGSRPTAVRLWRKWRRWKALYRDGYGDWSVRHFYDEVYVAEQGGARSDKWVKSRLQEAGLVRKRRRKGSHRQRRDRKPAAGMMLHQDALTHEWVPEQWWDLRGVSPRVAGPGNRNRVIANQYRLRLTANRDHAP